MATMSKKTALVGILIIAAALSVWRFILQPWQEREAAVPNPVTNVDTQPPSPKPASESTSGEEVSAVKTATVRTSYKNPGGADEVGFSVSVDGNGIITKASVEVLAKNPTSIMRQEAFAEGLPQAIQGKKLSDLNSIDKVGGSSLTTGSFNVSLAQLKAGI